MKKKLVVCLAAGLLISGVVRMAQASPIIPVSATGTGTFHGSPSLLIDGFIPPEYTWYTASTIVWSYYADPNPQYTIDLGSLYQVEDITISVDNNDDYVVQYSIDNLAYSDLFTILSSYGNVSSVPGGMDTMTTIFGDPQYVSAIDFTTVEARYLRIFGTRGDHEYGVGELMPFGQAAVPEPATMLLLGTGIAGLVGTRIRRRKK